MTPDLCFVTCDLWPRQIFLKINLPFLYGHSNFQTLLQKLMTHEWELLGRPTFAPPKLQRRVVSYYYSCATVHCYGTSSELAAPPQTVNWLWKRFAVGEFTVNVRCVSCNRDSFSLTEVYLENNRSERASWTLGMLPLNDIQSYETNRLFGLSTEFMHEADSASSFQLIIHRGLFVETIDSFLSVGRIQPKSEK